MFIAVLFTIVKIETTYSVIKKQIRECGIYIKWVIKP